MTGIPYFTNRICGTDLWVLARLLLLLSLSQASAAAAAPQPLALSALRDGDTLTNIEYLYTYQGDEAMNPAALAQGKGLPRPFQILSSSPAVDYQAQGLWLRLALTNDTPHASTIVLYALPTHFQFQTYEVSNSGKLETILQAEDDANQTEHKIYSRYPGVRLSLQAGSTRSFLVNLQSNDILRPQLSLAREKQFLHHNRITDSLVPLYYGLVLALCLYNLFLYIHTRARSYLLYVTFATSFCLMLASTDGFADLLMPNLWGSWAQVYPQLYMLAIIAVNFLAPGLLDIPRTNRLLHYFIRATTLVLVCLMALTSLVGLRVLAFVDGITFVLTCFYFVYGLRQALAGSRPAQYFSLAWSSLLLACLVSLIGPHVSDVKQEVLYYSFYVGSALEVFLMSFALAARVNSLEKEKFEANYKAHEAAKLQDLLRILCHDISAPLAIVSGHAQLALQAKSGLTDDAKNRWEKVERAIGVANDILHNVKYLESIRANKLALDLQTVSVRDGLKHMLFIFEKDLQNKNLVLTSNLLTEGEPDLFIRSDRIGFYNQVLGNIISNAIKFSFPGQPIEVFAQASDAVCLITIRDYGIGISPATKASLFSPHIKTTELGTRGETGTGFGMPIVKSFVELCGGSIEVQSNLRDGTNADHGTLVRLTMQRIVPTGQESH